MNKTFLTILGLAGAAFTINAAESSIAAFNLSRLDNLVVKTDSNFVTNGYVSNVGSQPINSIEYSYTVDGEYAGNGVITFAEPLLPDPGKEVELSFEFNGISSFKEHTVAVTIEKVNGEANTHPNPATTFISYAVPHTPVRRALVEEYTGLWCQWCPRGYVAMEEVNKFFPDDAVVACYHNGDAMAITNTYPIQVSGYPKGSVDRNFIGDPYIGYYGSERDRIPGIFNVIYKSIGERPLATIEITNVETGDFGIKFDIETIFWLDPGSSNYEVGYLLTANGLTNPKWYQMNAYSGMYGFEGTPLEMFTKLPTMAYGLVYNDVVVNVDAMNGIPGSLPSVELGVLYENSITIPMNKISLTDNLESIMVNAFVINKSTGMIVNANKTPAYVENPPENENPDAGVEDVDSGLVIEKEYFDISGRKIETPSQGIYIVKSRMEDGSIKTEKIVIR